LQAELGADFRVYLESMLGDLLLDLVQRPANGSSRRCGHDAGIAEHEHMCPRAPDVELQHGGIQSNLLRADDECSRFQFGLFLSWKVGTLESSTVVFHSDHLSTFELSNVPTFPPRHLPNRLTIRAFWAYMRLP